MPRRQTDYQGRIAADIDGLPPVSPAGEARLYYDHARSQVRISKDGGPYEGLASGIFENVRDHGAKGDTRFRENAAMTAGQATVTSATAAFTAADVGKFISVRDASSEPGGTMVGTIAAYLSPTQVRSSVVADATVSNKRVLWGTIDTAAIQASMDAVNAARQGVIYFPAGDYLIDAQLELRGGSDADPVRSATVTGEHGATIWMADVDIPYEGPGDVLTGSCLMAVDCEDVTIRDLIFRGPDNGFAGPALTVVRLTGIALNGRLQNITVRDFQRAFPIDYSGQRHCVMSGCSVDGCAYGLLQSNLGGSCNITGCIVTNMRIPATLYGCIVTSGTGNTILGNYLEPPDEGVAIDIIDAGRHATILGNRIKGGDVATATAIRLKGDAGGDVTISGNDISGCGKGIVANGTVVSIAGNVIRGDGAGYTGVETFYLTNPASLVTITGNTFVDMAKGIDGGTLASDRVTVTGNTFGADVATPVSDRGAWTNSKGVGNAGLADF